MRSKLGNQHPRAYQSWMGMLRRCRNTTAEQYPRYGGRGISVCARWYAFPNFLADMGEPAEGLTLERIDSNGNYEKSNCRWATRKEQSNNRCTNLLIALNGETLNVTQWAERFGIKPSTAYRRMARGWPVDVSLFMGPIKPPLRRLAPPSVRDITTGRFVG